MEGCPAAAWDQGAVDVLNTKGAFYKDTHRRGPQKFESPHLKSGFVGFLSKEIPWEIARKQQVSGRSLRGVCRRPHVSCHVATVVRASRITNMVGPIC